MDTTYKCNAILMTFYQENRPLFARELWKLLGKSRKDWSTLFPVGKRMTELNSFLHNHMVRAKGFLASFTGRKKNGCPITLYSLTSLAPNLDTVMRDLRRIDATGEPEKVHNILKDIDQLNVRKWPGILVPMSPRPQPELEPPAYAEQLTTNVSKLGTGVVEVKDSPPVASAMTKDPPPTGSSSEVDSIVKRMQASIELDRSVIELMQGINLAMRKTGESTLSISMMIQWLKIVCKDDSALAFECLSSVTGKGLIGGTFFFVSKESVTS